MKVNKVNIFRSHNSNTNNIRLEGKVSDEAQGIMPPNVRTYYSEQYNGRETSVHFFQKEEDLVWSILYNNGYVSKDYQSGSSYYSQFVEIWEENKLVAIITDPLDYMSPRSHLEKQKEYGICKRKNIYQSYNLIGKYYEELIAQGEKAVVEHFIQKMQIPAAMDKEWLEKNYPGYIPRSVEILLF